MRADTNKIAVRAIRNILDAANSFDVDVGTKKVSCDVSRGTSVAWPDDVVRPDDASGAPAAWPALVIVSCTWDGGKCSLWVPHQGTYLDRTHGCETVHVGLFEAGRWSADAIRRQIATLAPCSATLGPHTTLRETNG